MSEYVIKDGELYHHGIKGQKWGKRRYQNKDGTLTPEGKKRYDRDIAENNAKKKDNRIVIDGPDTNRWVKEDITRTRGVVDASKNLTREVENLNKNIPSQPKKKPMDLSNMTDQEMRAQINRAVLERQYDDLYNPKHVSRGREVVADVLSTIGSVLAIGSSALGIALAVKELKGG